MVCKRVRRKEIDLRFTSICSAFIYRLQHLSSVLQARQRVHSGVMCRPEGRLRESGDYGSSSHVKDGRLKEKRSPITKNSLLGVVVDTPSGWVPPYCTCATIAPAEISREVIYTRSPLKTEERASSGKISSAIERSLYHSIRRPVHRHRDAQTLDTT